MSKPGVWNMARGGAGGADAQAEHGAGAVGGHVAEIFNAEGDAAGHQGGLTQQVGRRLGAVCGRRRRASLYRLG